MTSTRQKSDNRIGVGVSIGIGVENAIDTDSDSDSDPEKLFATCGENLTSFSLTACRPAEIVATKVRQRREDDEMVGTTGLEPVTSAV